MFVLLHRRKGEAIWTVYVDNSGDRLPYSGKAPTYGSEVAAKVGIEVVLERFGILYGNDEWAVGRVEVKAE